MDRIAQTRKRMEQLFGSPAGSQDKALPQADLQATDPELAQIHDRLVHGDIDHAGCLTDRERVLVTLATLATLQTVDEIGRVTQAGLALGVTPLEMREALYQCAPYAGLSRIAAALKPFNAALMAAGIALPLEKAGTVDEDNRFAEGLAVQKRLFGEAIDTMHKNAPRGQEDILIEHLSAWCFGDTYTRTGLDLPTRELLTFVCIASLGGCEAQVKAHTHGNAGVGTSKQKLVDTLCQMLPYIGFPRTLNALACVNEVLKDQA